MSKHRQAANTFRRPFFFFGRRGLFRFFVPVVVLVAIAGSLWWNWRHDTIQLLVDKGRWALIAGSAQVGLRVQNILVTGRYETSVEDLRRAVGLVRGVPIFAFDPADIKTRIETLPWVRTASVKRMLPDTVAVQVQERQPMAVWQRRGRFYLIDAAGEVISDKGLERFPDMLLVVGENARLHMAGLIRILQTEPELMTRVRAAVLVGSRRWDVRMANGVDVRLPEKKADRAWGRLADYERTYQILGRDVTVLDLRFPGRVIIKRPPQKGRSKMALRHTDIRT